MLWESLLQLEQLEFYRSPGAGGVWAGLRSFIPRATGNEL